MNANGTGLVHGSSTVNDTRLGHTANCELLRPLLVKLNHNRAYTFAEVVCSCYLFPVPYSTVRTDTLYVIPIISTSYTTNTKFVTNDHQSLGNITIYMYTSNDLQRAVSNQDLISLTEEDYELCRHVSGDVGAFQLYVEVGISDIPVDSFRGNAP